MTDDEQLVQRLRGQLDEELGDVRARAGSRERLRRGMRDRRRLPWFRASVLVPAAAAVTIAALLLAIPALLHRSREMEGVPAAPPPAAPAPMTQAPSARPMTQAPSATPFTQDSPQTTDQPDQPDVKRSVLEATELPTERPRSTQEDPTSRRAKEQVRSTPDTGERPPGDSSARVTTSAVPGPTADGG